MVTKKKKKMAGSRRRESNKVNPTELLLEDIDQPFDLKRTKEWEKPLKYLSPYTLKINWIKSLKCVTDNIHFYKLLYAQGQKEMIL